MQAYLGTIVFKFGRDPVICLREEAMYMYIMYIMYIVTNRLQYFAPAIGRSKNVFCDRWNPLYDKSASLRCDGKLFNSLG